MTGKTMVWVGVVTTVAAVGGLIWYIDREGMNQAASLSGVVGIIPTLAGVALTIYGLVLQRRDSAGGQSFSGTAGGSVSMVRNVKGKVSIKSTSSENFRPADADTAPRAAPTDGQHASGLVYGPVHLVDGGEEVEIE
ncbi:hypothetical protein ACWEP4_26595 [Streptomyces sp. NPDC004227]